MMPVPVGPTVLIMCTLGVEVERPLWRDEPSAPGMGNLNAEAGDRSPILGREGRKERVTPGENGPTQGSPSRSPTRTALTHGQRQVIGVKTPDAGNKPVNPEGGSMDARV